MSNYPLLSPSNKTSARGFSLLEVLIAQVIAFIVMAGVCAMIAAFIKSYHATDGTVQAQVRMRQITHVLLRDLQAVGGSDGSAGELVVVEDGGTSGPDSIDIFKKNELCAGLQIVEINNTQIQFGRTDGNTCDATFFDSKCPASNIEYIALKGKDTGDSVRITGSLNQTNCLFSFNNNLAYNKEAAKRLEASNPGAFSPSDDMREALTFLVGDPSVECNGTITYKCPFMYVGNRYRYSVANEQLFRQKNSEAPKIILDSVYDLQVAQAFDLDGDGVICDNPTSCSPYEYAGRTVGQTADPAALSPVGTARNFLGVEVIVVTYARAKDNISHWPPNSLFNRTYSMTPDEKARRYRWNKMFMAARNRI